MPACWRTVVVFCVLVVWGVGAVRLKCRLGELEGARLITPRTGRPYYAFTSLPYAQPPLGPLRLKNPVRLEKWEGVLDATKDSPLCLQIPFYLAKENRAVTGQEDCLYLNVYTPTVDPSSKLPVLVYIHGGGFRCGHPVLDKYAESNFIEEDVVLVTVHYRLGILGFLSTEDSEVPGNFGLKDQAMAIKWVSENIEAFGGDSSLITVFGESAGGASSHLLLSSPLTRDLLRGAISQSGLYEGFWAIAPQGKPRRNAKKVSEIVGCNLEKDFLKCLQKIDAKTLQSAENNFVVWDFDPIIVFQPVIERNKDGAFLVEDPRNMSLTKPFITGLNSGEGLIKSASILNQAESVLDEFINDIDNILPHILFLEPGKLNVLEFISVIKERYFNNLLNRQDTIKGLENLYRDACFIYPLHEALQKHSGPKYAYLYDHRSESSYTDILGNAIVDRDRPSHGDELMSLFNWTKSFPNKKGREEDRAVSIRLVKLWTNFARDQNPTPNHSEFIWNQYDNGNLLHIKTYTNEIIHWPYDDVIQFWEKAFKLLQPKRILKEEL